MKDGEILEYDETVMGQWITMRVCLCCRHGLLAYVYIGVSVLVSALVAGKWLLYTTAQ